MLFYCITSLEFALFDEDSTELSEINVSKIFNSRIYKLTRVSIDHLEKCSPVISRGRGKLLINVRSQEPIFVLIFHRDDEEERTIRMSPGAITVKPIDFKKNIIDLEFAKPKQCKEIWLKSMRIRNINSSPNKRFTDDEREHYLKYLNEMKDIVALKESQEEAFDGVKMQNLGLDKTLYQTMRDIRDAILTFCDSKNERIKAVPDDRRFIGKRPFKVHEKIHIQSQSDYTAYKYSKKRGWSSLIFETVHENERLQIQKFDEWFPATNLLILKFINVEFLDIDQNAFANLFRQMQLLIELQISANLENLPDIIFQKMPVSLEILNLSDNNLTEISQEIAGLKNLKCLYVDNNVLIKKIPFEYLTEGLLELSLRNTAISIIPEEIQRFCSLEDLKLGNTTIEHLCWNSINENLLWLEIGFVKNFEEMQNFDFPKMKELSISNNDFAKKIKTKYFPKSLLHLQLKNNSIQNLCGYFDLPLLNTVDLSNNNLKDFPWWFLLHPMEKVNLSNNEIEVLCSPLHWLRIKYLNLSNNKISSIDLPEENEDEKNIVAKDSPGIHLNLSGNNLTSLPFKFEKIIQIVSLNLSKNKFEYDSAEESLYQRLPLTLKKLNVSEMPLISLSCTLCYRMLKELVASNCQLRYICPKISHQFFHIEPFDIQRNLKLNITHNPDLEGLPFVPDTIIPYPKKHDKIVKSSTFWRQMESEINTFKVLTFASFQNTERLAFKMEFNSLKDKKNAKYYCKCCAKCGRDTKEDIFQQIMTMDFDVFETTEKEKILNYWASGTWKANVVTKLCGDCKNEYKNDVKELLTSKKRKQQEKKKDAKKQRVVKILPQQNAVVAEMPESSKLQYYPDSNGCSSQTAPVMFPPALSFQTMSQYYNTDIEPMDYECEMSNANYPSQSFQNMLQLQFSNNFIPPQNYFPMPPQKTSFISLPPLRFANGYHELQQQCIEIQNLETINPENTYTNL